GKPADGGAAVVGRGLARGVDGAGSGGVVGLQGAVGDRAAAVEGVHGRTVAAVHGAGLGRVGQAQEGAGLGGEDGRQIVRTVGHHVGGGQRRFAAVDLDVGVHDLAVGLVEGHGGQGQSRRRIADGGLGPGAVAKDDDVGVAAGAVLAVVELVF